MATITHRMQPLTIEQIAAGATGVLGISPGGVLILPTGEEQGSTPSSVTPTSLGAVLDGTTNDQAAIQAWIDYHEGLATVTGAKVTATFPAGKSFKINSSLSIDLGKVMINWNGSICIPAAGIDAILISSSNNDQNAKGTQIMGGMENLYLNGDDGDTGRGLVFQAGGLGTSHAQIRNCYIRDFLTGVDMSANDCYLVRFWECLVNGCGTGLKMSDVSNSGEMCVYFGGNVNSNGVAIDYTEGNGHFAFFGTSFDFNDKIANIQSCNVTFEKCHFENSAPDEVQFTVSGARANVSFISCLFWSGGSAPHPLDEWITATDPAVVRGHFCEFFNTRATNNRFASGNVEFFNSYSHNSTSNNRICSKDRSLIKGDFESGIPGGFQVAGATTNRLSAGGATLAQSTALARSGTNSLLYTKSTGAGDSTANWTLFVPIPRGASVVFEAWHAKASGGASENWFHTQRWADVRFTGDGNYTAVINSSIGTSSAIQSTTTWQSFSSNGFDTAARQAPAWANCWMIDFNFNALAAQSIHFDDWVVTFY